MFSQLNFRHTPLTLTLIAIMVGLELVATLGDFSENNDRRNTLITKLGISPMVWGHKEVSRSEDGQFVAEYKPGEYWRPFTTSILHGNFIHAFFNIYWLMIFGNVLERRYGPWKLSGLILFLAYFSIMMQFIVSNFNLFEYNTIPGIGFLGQFFSDHDRYIPCVGFSGVGYGLFGFIWYARVKVHDFGWVCTKSTVQAFLVWFLICLFLTGSGAMPIANMAHGAGLVLGYVLARAIYSPTKNERINFMTLALFAAFLCLVMLAYTPPVLRLLSA